MEGELWRNLPEELLERIVEKLPFRSILPLRCVSKKWNAFILTRASVRRCSTDHAPKGFLLHLMHGCEAVAAYNPTLQTWHKLSLSFIPRELKVSSLLAAAGGMLCAYVSSEHSNERGDGLMVCNPITKAWRRLPPTLNAMRHGSSGKVMMFDASSESYKIFIVGMHSCYNRPTTQVYDSSTNVWEIGARVPEGFSFVPNGVLCKGCLYITGRKVDGGKLVFYYDLKQAVWMELEVELPRCLVWPHLVERHGTLLLVAGVHNRWKGSRSIQIWELDESRLKWVEVERMPDRLLGGFIACFESKDNDFECVGQGDMIYFATDWFVPMLCYDFSQRSWSQMSPTKFGCREEMFIFDPTFHNSV